MIRYFGQEINLEPPQHTWISYVLQHSPRECERMQTIKRAREEPSVSWGPFSFSEISINLLLITLPLSKDILVHKYMKLLLV
jgi:hypothetical protein